jgi:hypothetical protein
MADVAISRRWKDGSLWALAAAVVVVVGWTWLSRGITLRQWNMNAVGFVGAELMFRDYAVIPRAKGQWRMQGYDIAFARKADLVAARALIDKITKIEARRRDLRTEAEDILWKEFHNRETP